MSKLKVVVLGSENVGKTTIMENILDKIGKVEYRGTTIAIDYGNLVSMGRRSISSAPLDRSVLNL